MRISRSIAPLATEMDTRKLWCWILIHCRVQATARSQGGVHVTGVSARDWLEFRARTNSHWGLEFVKARHCPDADDFNITDIDFSSRRPCLQTQWGRSMTCLRPLLLFCVSDSHVQALIVIRSLTAPILESLFAIRASLICIDLGELVQIGISVQGHRQEHSYIRGIQGSSFKEDGPYACSAGRIWVLSTPRHKPCSLQAWRTWWCVEIAATWHAVKGICCHIAKKPNQWASRH